MNALTTTPRRPRLMFRPFALAARERRHLLSEMAQVRGLIPLIMKRRNQLPWTASERAELRSHIKRLSSMSPYLMCFVMPGGLALLPALAWWLDRRRRRMNLIPLERRKAEIS